MLNEIIYAQPFALPGSRAKGTERCVVLWFKE